MENWYKISKKVGNEYSWVYVNLPLEAQNMMLSFGEDIKEDDLYTKEAENGLEKEPHITIKYGLLIDFPKDIKERIQKEKGGKFYMGASSFFSCDKYDVLKIDIDSEDLDRLHDKLNALQHNDEFPEYHPHSTIAYLKKGTGKDYVNRFKIDKTFKFNTVYFGNKKGRNYSIFLS